MSEKLAFALPRREIVKVTASASIGSLVEWYDFFIAGSAAALVWPQLFFTGLNPAVGFAMSVLTYAIVYLIRPIGAFLFGHMGDKLGRKSTLIWTLFTMGLGTLGIAVLPTYTSIGVMAPILLNVFRLVQGLGVGGEWQGAASWVAEFVPKSKRRGFWTGWVAFVVALGGFVATIVFLMVRTSMPPRDFLSWGWRIPFAIGVVILVIGVIIRYRVMDSPLFAALKQAGRVEKSPALETLKRNLGRILTLGAAWTYVIMIFSGVMILFSVSYLTRAGMNPVAALISVAFGTLSAAFFGLVGASLSDVLGRKHVMIIGAILTIIVTYPYFLLLNTLNYGLVVLAQIMLNAATWIGYGVLPSSFTEHFETKYRYSGSGLSYQMGALFAGIVVGFILPAILVAFAGPRVWQYVAALAIAITVIGLVATAFIKETRETELTV